MKGLKTISIKITKRKKKLDTKQPPKVKKSQAILMEHPEIPTHEPGWTEIIPETDLIKFYQKLKHIINKRNPDTAGSFHVTVRLNGGYAKNKEIGGTMELHFKGILGEVYKILHNLKIKQPIVEDKELNELINKYCD